MSQNSGTLESLAQGVLNSLSPLKESLAGGDIISFFSSMGMVFPDSLKTLPAFQGSINKIITLAEAVPSQITQLKDAIDADDYAQIAHAIISIANSVKGFIDAFKELRTAFETIKNSFPGQVIASDIENFALQIPEKLFSYLLVTYLEGYFPLWLRILHLTDIIQISSVNGGAGATGPALHTVKKLNLGAIQSMFTDPATHFQNLYKWGRPDFDGVQLLNQIHLFAQTFSFPLVADLASSTPSLNFSVGTLQPILTGTDKGIELIIKPDLPTDFKMDIPFIFDGTKLKFDLKTALALDTRIKFFPKGKVEIVPPSGNVNGEIEISVVKEPIAPATQIFLFGQSGGSRFTIKSFTAGIGIGAAWNGTAATGNYRFFIKLEGGEIVLKLGDGDGFISSILPSEIRLNEDMLIGYSTVSGFYFEGSGGIQIKFPTHIELGPVELQALQFALKLSPALSLETGANIKADFGPLQAVVENIGLKTQFDFPSDNSGNLGPVNISFGFKPPNGVGLSIDAAIVKGGGYLYFDFDKEEYAGVLELSLAAIVTVKAIGLITTRMPDGSKGFSLLLIITAEFGSGIQLGFGFTLLGVGGLIGLNRTMLLEPLAAGVRSGSINSIMFPEDPVANASRIINDLRTYFPACEGRFLVGPMMKIGWGTPTLISLSLGIIIEIPGNVAILGILSINLPAPEAALITINVAFIGALEFDKSRVWFFAAMFESRILFMTLEGEMGLLMAWGDDPNFVLSVGGFHPAFNPPPLPFPNPRRIHIDVLRNPLQRITVENYFAITSNTLQFGASAELFFGISAFNIHGNFSFDALFQFSPFHFIIDISFSVGMEVFGIGLFSVSLRLSLEGPGLWRARGTATLSIDLWLFSIDISVDFDISWGQADQTALVPVTAIPILIGEYDKLENWKVNLPDSSKLSVTLRQLELPANTLVLHPLGTIQISQRTLPLGIKVDKIGNQPVSDAHLFSVTATGDLVKGTLIPTEKFAIAQFQNMSDADKLSRRSFESIESGIELSCDGRQMRTSRIVKRIVRYELTIIDTHYKRFARKWFSKVGTLFFHWLNGAAVTKSKHSFAYKKSLTPTTPDERIKIVSPGFVVAGVADNKALNSTASFTSQAHASDYMNQQILLNPAIADEIHVIPICEASLS